MSENELKDYKEILGEKTWLTKTSVYSKISPLRFELAAHHFRIENFIEMLDEKRQQAYFNGISEEEKKFICDYIVDNVNIPLSPAIVEYRNNQQMKKVIQEEIGDVSGSKKQNKM